MKKGILGLLTVYTLAAALAVPVGLISASAASDRTEAGLVANFSDDFDSYETDKWIEDTEGFSLKWSNNVLDDGEELGMDTHLRERAKIEYENGTSGNKVLHLDNRIGGNSFFYIAPKGDYRYKNYNVSFRVKFIQATGWVSAVVRKDLNVWYNGCNNLNATLFVAGDHSCMQVIPYRNMPGAADQQLKTSATLDSDGYTLATNNYINGTNTYLNEWFDVRYEMNEKSYKIFINDTLIMDLFYPSRKLLDFGYVSLGGCTADVYFDDFAIENFDTEAPPALEEEEPETNDSSVDSTNSEQSTTDSNEQAQEKTGGCGGYIATSVVSATLLAAGAVLLNKKKKE